METLLWIFLFVSSITTSKSEVNSSQDDDVLLSLQYHEISGVVGEELSVIVNVEKSPRLIASKKNPLLNLSLSTDVEEIMEFSNSSTVSLTEDAREERFEIKIMARHTGVATLFIHDVYMIDSNRKLDSKLNIRISIGRSKAIYNFSRLIGWGYVIAWNVASYPQLLKNFRRKR